MLKRSEIQEVVEARGKLEYNHRAWKVVPEVGRQFFMLVLGLCNLIGPTYLCHPWICSTASEKQYLYVMHSIIAFRNSHKDVLSLTPHAAARSDSWEWGWPTRPCKM